MPQSSGVSSDALSCVSKSYHAIGAASLKVGFKGDPNNKMPSPCGLGAVAHGGNPQDRAASPFLLIFC
ncbi:hypothetical protein COO91_10451 (plasmid) [Nostoc flagelliforme CCNUN1]|uniref:Uncharacterized protein n=1 Tax=Nostoc flagelliforme CCNUN1 TaxID=2038116 RepID=A0A2K8T954_9NOSO|nr:hypothetical protein COO91_10451 [Nostoc flagelliforme CCNUN1]